AKPLSGFFFDVLLKKHSIASIEAKAALKAEAVPLIKQILGENQRTMMMAQLKKICKEGDGHDYDADTKQANKQRKIKHTDYKSPVDIALSPLRMIIRLLLESPSLASSVEIVNPNTLSPDKISGLAMLIEIHDYCLQVPRANTATLFEAFRAHPHIHHLSKLFAATIEDNIDLEAEYIACFSTLVKWQVNARLDELMAKQEFDPLTIDETEELKALLLATDS
ncbi:MAG: DNA primase, partial [Alphaproteobacteria bacterium]